MPAITVMIVDDHALVRLGLHVVLDACDNIEVVAEAADGEEAIDQFARTTPDVVLMDLVMPVMDGATATAAIRRRCPCAKVVALTSFSDEDIIEGALRAGAVGYVLKTVSGQEIAAAIRAAHAGNPTLSSVATRTLMRVMSDGDRPAEALSKREREVLALVAQGLSNNEIAARLFLASSTVKTHVSRILAKLGASTRTEAAAYGIRHRLF
ncbi:MAG: response regulator [Thermoleophilia bacterium]